MNSHFRGYKTTLAVSKLLWSCRREARGDRETCRIRKRLLNKGFISIVLLAFVDEDYKFSLPMLAVTVHQVMEVYTDTAICTVNYRMGH